MRARWLGAIVAIAPLLGPAFAEGSQIGEIVPKVEFKDIRYLRRTLSDLGNHKGFALIFLNAECPVSRRFCAKISAGCPLRRQGHPIRGCVLLGPRHHHGDGLVRPGSGIAVPGREG